MCENNIELEDLNSTSLLIKRGAISFGSTALGVLSVYEGITALLGDYADAINNVSIFDRLIVWLTLSLIVSFTTIFITFKQLLKKNEEQKEQLKTQNQDLRNQINALNGNYDEYRSEHSDSICQLLGDAYESKRYQEVIKIGMQLSGPLWYAGKYELRAKVGEIVENAAAKIGDKSTLAKVLIEMVGWTNVRLGKESIGVDKINEGLLIAQEIDDKFLIAAAYRNLGDIHLGKATSNHNLRYSSSTSIVNAHQQGVEFQECYQCLMNAKQCIEGITDEKRKNEMSGNVYYTFSKYYYEKGEFEEALSCVDKAMDFYKRENNIEKQIKLYNLKGEILLMFPDKQAQAVNVFRNGIQMALQHNVNVHIVSNALSLSDYFYQKQQIEQSKRSLKDAIDYSVAITDPLLIEKLNAMKEKLEIE